MPGGKGHTQGWRFSAPGLSLQSASPARKAPRWPWMVLCAALLLLALTFVFDGPVLASGDCIEVRATTETDAPSTPVARSAELAVASQETPAAQSSAGLLSGNENEAAKVTEPIPKSLTLPLAEGSLYVEAYESVTYDRANRRVVLDGNALMVMANIQVEADHIEINDLAKNAYLKGSIAVQQEDDVIFADEGYLSYETQEFELINVSGNTSGPQVNGTIYFRADEAKGRFDDFRMYRVWLTTCPPTCVVYEYELTAKSARMQRDKVLMLYRVYAYAREHKIMFLPQLAIPLKRYRSLRQTRSPVEQYYGYNRTEGYFAKFAYTYDQRFVEEVSPSLLGVALLDITQKKGTGFGLRQDFVTPLGVTTLRGKYQRQYKGPLDEATGERGKPDRNYQLALLQELNFGRKLKGSFSMNRNNTYLIYRSRRNTMTGNLNLGYTSGDFTSRLTGTQNMNITGGYTTPSGSEVPLRKDFSSSLGFNNTFRINRLTTLTVNPSMNARKSNDGLPADLEGKFMSNLRFNRKDYSIALTYQESPIDLDGDRYTKDERMSVNNIKPGLTINFLRTSFSPNSPFTGLTLNLENVTKKLRSQTDIQPVVRFKADTGLSRSFGKSSHTRLTPSLKFSQYMYDDGNAQYTVSPSLRFNYDDRRWFKSNFTWGRSVQHGVKNPPVRGDAVRSRSNASFGMEFFQDPVWNWKLSSSYNFISKRWGNINSTMNLDPNPDFGATFSTSYSIEKATFQPLSSNWEFHSPADNWYLRVNLTTPLQAKAGGGAPYSIRRLTWTYARQYKRGWNFYLYSSQSGPKKQGPFFDRVQIQKRNTCTTLNFGFIGGSKTYYISIFINAFPRYPLESVGRETAQGWDFWVNTPTADIFSLSRGLGTGYGGYTGYGYGTTGQGYGGGWTGTPTSPGGSTVPYGAGPGIQY